MISSDDVIFSGKANFCLFSDVFPNTHLSKRVVAILILEYKGLWVTQRGLPSKHPCRNCRKMHLRGSKFQNFLGHAPRLPKGGPYGPPWGTPAYYL